MFWLFNIELLSLTCYLSILDPNIHLTMSWNTIILWWKPSFHTHKISKIIYICVITETKVENAVYCVTNWKITGSKLDEANEVIHFT
jgi:hypothetical protein